MWDGWECIKNELKIYRLNIIALKGMWITLHSIRAIVILS